MRALAALVSVLALGGLNLPAPAIAASAGEITHVSGAVVARKADGQSKILSVKSNVEEGDVLATAENSYARVKFADGGEVVLRPATQVKIDRFNFEERRPQSDGMVLSLLKGGMRAVTGLLGRRNPAAVRVATPSATIGIRGTTFTAELVPESPAALKYSDETVALAERAAREPPAGFVRASLDDVESLYPEKRMGMKDANEFLAGQAAGDLVAQAPRGGLAPGLYVQVIDGQINLTNKGGSQNFSAGQFGYTPNFNRPPVVLPSNPGLQFTPPPSFSAPSGAIGAVGKTGGLECTI